MRTEQWRAEVAVVVDWRGSLHARRRGAGCGNERLNGPVPRLPLQSHHQADKRRASRPRQCRREFHPVTGGARHLGPRARLPMFLRRSCDRSSVPFDCAFHTTITPIAVQAEFATLIQNLSTSSSIEYCSTRRNRLEGTVQCLNRPLPVPVRAPFVRAITS